MTKNDLKLFSFLLLCIILLGLSSAVQQVNIIFAPHSKKSAQVVVTPPPTPQLTYVPQFVIISFDGARNNELWKDLREFRETLAQEGKRINYTFFLNTAYFLTSETKKFYVGPGKPAGKTEIGNAWNVDEIRTRIHEMNMALAAGDEIATHATGHFSGKNWTKEEWATELASFDTILFGLDKLYPNDALPKLNLKPDDVVGIRAPYLEHSPGLYEYLHSTPRFRYDSSEIAAKDEWPHKDAQGLWHIPLTTMYIEHGTKPILAMDYNHYVHDSGAQDELKKGTPAWQNSYEDLLSGWRAYFTTSYAGNRAPVLVGYHFGQWNDGLYWEVMKEFAREVCGKPEVHCGTFKELVNYLDEYGVPKKE